MLTMGQPIQLKTRKPMDTLGDGFAERIIGNYQMLEEQMTPSDMLHFISAPPELYTEEAGMAPLVNQQTNVNTQNMTLQLVNNVLNRILVSDSLQMTYQDRVFVENVLNKIGVTDVQEFIRQVRLMKEETKNTRELLRLYHSDNQVLRTLREYRAEEREKERAEGRESEETEQVRLERQTREIWNRLHTEEIYREMSNLVSIRYGSPVRITRQEMQLSEQSISAEYLTLNRMRSETFSRNQDLVYNRINTYEAGEGDQITENYEETVSSMVKAVLLNAISQIYHMRYSELTTHAANWKWLTDAIHVNAQNTFQRFESYHNQLRLSKEEKNEYHETLQNYERREITALQSLFEHTEEVTVNRPEIRNLTENELEYRTEVNLTEEPGRIEETFRELTEQQETEHKHVYKISEKKREQEIRKQLELINQQNLERIEKLRSLTQEEKKTAPPKIDRKRAKKDALRALENPEEVLMEYLETPTKESETERIETERLKEILGADTVQILETLKGYQEHPERYPNVTTSEGQAMNYLMQDIRSQEEPESEVRPAEVPELLHTRIREESSREVQKVLKETERFQTERVPFSPRQVEAVREEVELFHKQNETAFSEEFLEELEERNRRNIQSETRTTTEQIQETNHVDRLVTNKVNELKLAQDQDIERIVSQNVRRQLNSLSDQVFTKLEKRMDAERRRRGI